MLTYIKHYFMNTILKKQIFRGAVLEQRGKQLSSEKESCISCFTVKNEDTKSGICGRILSTTGSYHKSYVISFPTDVDEFCNHYRCLSHEQVMFYGASEGIFHIDQDVVSLTLNSLKGKLFKVILT